MALNEERIWNSDGVQAEILFNIKQDCILCFRNGDLEALYHSLRSLWREFRARCSTKEKSPDEKTSEKVYLDSLMETADSKREEWLKDPKEQDKRLELYLSLEAVYLEICDLMKKYRIYYKDIGDASRAIFKRG